MTATAAKKETALDASSPYGFSVQRDVPNQRRYILRIEEDARDPSSKIVPIINGDYQVNVYRGRFWVVPEAVITVLKDAQGDTIDAQGRTVGKYRAFPFSYQPYDGNAPLLSEVDENGEPAKRVLPTYN